MVAQLVAHPPPDITPPLILIHAPLVMVILIFGRMDRIRSFTARQNPPICNPLLYIFHWIFYLDNKYCVVHKVVFSHDSFFSINEGKNRIDK